MIVVLFLLLSITLFSTNIFFFFTFLVSRNVRLAY